MKNLLVLAALLALPSASALDFRLGGQGGYVAMNPALQGGYGGGHIGVRYPVRWFDGRWSLQHTLDVQVVDRYPVVQFDSTLTRAVNGLPGAYYGLGLGSGVVPGNAGRMAGSTLTLLNAHVLFGAMYPVERGVNVYAEGVARAHPAGFVSAQARAGLQFRF